MTRWTALETALSAHGRGPPLSLDPLFDAADRVGDTGAIRLLVNSYARIIDRARYSRREPTEKDATACEKVVDLVTLTWVMPFLVMADDD